MYQFLLNMWVMGRITEEGLQLQVDKGRISQNEYDMIIATPKEVEVK